LTWTAERLLLDENLNDYDRLVKGLNLLEVEDMLQLFQDDDDEDDAYNLQEDEGAGEDEDEEEKDGVTRSSKTESQTTKKANEAVGNRKSSDELDAALKTTTGENFDLGEFGNTQEELEEELGWLEEEDIEAAVASLLDHNSKLEEIKDDRPAVGERSSNANADGESGAVAKDKKEDKSQEDSVGATTPAASNTCKPITSTPFKQKTVVTQKQTNELSDLLEKHYQLLVQQAVLTVRAANYHKYHRSRTDRTDFLAGGETGDDLVEILDAAVGMLSDLGNNRKDAFRHFLQFKSWKRSSKGRSTRDQNHVQDDPSTSEPPIAAPKRALFGETLAARSSNSERRLTRLQFQRTMIEQSTKEQSAKTVFDIRGLVKLDETFTLIDKSVSVRHDDEDQTQLLEIDSTKEACEYVLNATQQAYDKSLVPGSCDISDNFCDAHEFLGPTFVPPANTKQQIICKKNRNLFTAGEDNLVLRGVNLYGEKQWVLISERFLPERSTNVISQRYSKLCVMLYKANGVKIDSDGKLETPPKLESIDDIDEKAMSQLKPVKPPAVLNVHRWSLEEDLTLLLAVPLMGHMWAELGARLIPHRDRGHLRKRYQVLERRVKSTVERSNKRNYAKQLDDNASRSSKAQSEYSKKFKTSHVPIEARPVGPESSSYPTPTRSTAAVRAHPTPQRSGRAPPDLPGTSASKSKSPHPSKASVAGSPASIHPPPPYSPYHGAPPHYAYPYPSPYLSPPHSHHHYPPHLGYSPYGHFPPYFDPHNMDEGSRAAFEKLAQEGEHQTVEGGWSNMTNHLKELSRTETMVASAMANDLAKSPSKKEAEKLQEQGSQASSKRELASFQAGEKTASPGEAPRRASAATPSKEDAVKDPSKAIYSTDGTQIGLSPAFQSSPTKGHWPKIAAMASPAVGEMSLSSFPATSNMGYSPVERPSSGHEALRSAQSTPSKRKSLFQDGVENSLEHEAISGLELMANSPALPPSGGSESRINNSGSNAGRSSLFSKVVGDKNSGDKKKDDRERKKRKLVF